MYSVIKIIFIKSLILLSNSISLLISSSSSFISLKNTFDESSFLLKLFSIILFFLSFLGKAYLTVISGNPENEIGFFLISSKHFEMDSFELYVIYA